MNGTCLTCRFCGDNFHQLKQYLCHLKHHRHLNQTFPCGLCSEVISSEGSLRNHLRRRHGISVRAMFEQSRGNPLNSHGQLICTVSSCLKEFDTFSNLMRHLGDHITAGCAVKCPFPSCLKTYSVFGSLRGHVFMIHRQANPTVVPQCEPHDDDDDPVGFVDDDQDCHDNTNAIDASLRNHELWQRGLAEFYMSLEFKFLVPARTVQKISGEIQSVHCNAMSTVLAVIEDRSLTHDEKYATLKRIIAQFETGFSDLRSSYMRNNYFKKEFMYVAPKKIPLIGKKFFYYVPIIETLQKMMASKCLEIQLDAPTCSERGVYADFYDGLLYKTNFFFRENRKAFRIILFQDAFEMACPIGPAKKKYKMIGIYLSLGNIPAHMRTHVDAIQLVGLCLDSSFDHQQVYGPIVVDLKEIEKHGCVIPGHGTVKGSLIYISGDNLGSHELGGFNANFSKSRYFCRYCLIRRPDFYAYNGHYASFPARDKDNYNAALQGKNITSRKGIKFNSLFNELQNFHVTDPGLPPCLGHDVLEGVAAHDVSIYFNYFVEEKKWFTYEQVEEIMSSFPYSDKDRRDKPLPLKPTHEKINGGMWQIYNFIRLVPLMIHHLIKNLDDPVWKLFITIGEIVDILCAPVIQKSYIAHLQSLIAEYLDVRRSSFTNDHLRPKHHYLTHYCELILLFGPLGKLWTLRFESKHGFFKDCVRASKNFKNPTFSCCERHELFQAFIRAGGGLRCSLKIYKSSAFEPEVFCPDIQSAIRRINCNNLTQCSRCDLKGTVYSKGAILALAQTLYEVDVTFGRIVFILIENECKVYFLVEVLESQFISDIRFYHLGKGRAYHCIAYDDLASVYPMQAYRYKTNLYVKLKYALVSKMMSFHDPEF